MNLTHPEPKHADLNDLDTSDLQRLALDYDPDIAGAARQTLLVRSIVMGKSTYQEKMDALRTIPFITDEQRARCMKKIS